MREPFGDVPAVKLIIRVEVSRDKNICVEIAAGCCPSGNAVAGFPRCAVGGVLAGAGSKRSEEGEQAYGPASGLIFKHEETNVCLRDFFVVQGNQFVRQAEKSAAGGAVAADEHFDGAATAEVLGGCGAVQIGISDDWQIHGSEAGVGDEQ